MSLSFEAYTKVSVNNFSFISSQLPQEFFEHLTLESPTYFISSKKQALNEIDLDQIESGVFESPKIKRKTFNKKSYELLRCISYLNLDL